MWKVICPETSTVLVKVIDGVKVTVGVTAGVYPLILNDIPTVPQKSPLGVGVGVTNVLSIIKFTSSQGTLGLGVGSGSQSQSKYALKLKIEQSTGVGVGVGQIPPTKSFAEISGH
jgi:hypothetical protein